MFADEQFRGSNVSGFQASFASARCLSGGSVRGGRNIAALSVK